MTMFTKKDLYCSVITGLISGFISWRVFIFLELSEFANLSYVWLVIFIPILWILGVKLGYFLGQWLSFFNQFGKFAAVGFTNAAVYFGILNVFIYFSDLNKGIWYSVFVAVAFIVGTIHSYFWNKFWVFEVANNKVTGAEFSKFFAVYIVAGLINVGLASGVVNFMTPLFGFSLDQWANVGGVVGSAVALTVSFAGVKLTVFKT